MSHVLIEAVNKDNLEQINKLLIDLKANINTYWKDGYTALHLAASNGYFAIVQTLIAAGADVNLTDNMGCTALHWAVNNGHSLIVQALIAVQANVNLADNEDSTALHAAATKGYIHIVQALIAAGADVNLTDNMGNTALHFAASNGHILIVQILIAAQADINLYDNGNATALHLAASNSHLAIVQTLIAAGAFIDMYMPENMSNSEQEKVLDILTPLETATKQLFTAASNPKIAIKDIESILSTLGTALNGRLWSEHQDNTALHTAIKNNPLLALALIARGVSIDVFGDNKLSVRNKLNQLDPQELCDDNVLTIKLCLAFSKMYDLKKRVSQYVLSIDDTSLNATATASASASASTSFVDTLKKNSELEKQLLDICKLLEDKPQSLEDMPKILDEDNSFDLKEKNETDTIEIYLEHQRQFFNFELGVLIFQHPDLFPNKLDMVEHLLKTIKREHPHFQMANAHLFEIIQKQEDPDKTQFLSKYNDFIFRKIKYLAYADAKSTRKEALGDLMANALGNDSANQALRKLKATQADLTLTLFNIAKNQSNLIQSAQRIEQEALTEMLSAKTRVQEALAREQKANLEIEKLKLLLISNRNSKSDLDEPTAKSDSTPTIHSGSKRKHQESITLTAAAPVSITATSEILHDASLKSAVNVATTSVSTGSTTSSKPEEHRLSAKKIKT